MNRANPADLRKALETANAMVRAGILFVPMPVVGDHQALAIQANERLERMAKEAE